MTKPRTSAAEDEKMAQTAPPSQQLIVPAPVGNGRLIVPPGTPAAHWPTNLPVDTPRGRAILLNAMSTADLMLGPDGQVDVLLAYFFAHPVEMVDPTTGEVVQASRLVMIGPDGTTYASTSPVIAHRIAHLIDLFGPGPWAPPVPISIYRRRARNTGREYHDLKIDLRGMP